MRRSYNEAPTGLREYYCEPFHEDEGALFYFHGYTFTNCKTGLHFLEVVKDGKSEVLTLVLYDDEVSAMEILFSSYNQNKPIHLSVDVGTQVTNSVSQHYTIKQPGSQVPINTYQIKIRFYYDTDKKKPQSCVCDNAGIIMNESPYYVDYTKKVRTYIGKDYVEITFNDGFDMANDTLQLSLRFYQNDWSAYEGFKERSVNIYYDDNIIYHKMYTDKITE